MTQQEINEQIQQNRETILANEALLQQEDYKIIKCAEAKVADTEMPYDTEELIARRNSYRDAINRAEADIAILEATEAEEPEPREELSEDDPSVSE